ncbi:MAG: SpoVA/SpoVAEb family sporulation membrane protein [Christensenellaceae bacterium]|nr:SpoVA/SpoVAEb family sporulation membrane protein [Christensenellaceae bacterium]
MNEHNKEYLKFVNDHNPKTKHLATLVRAFFVGGFISCLGQSLYDIYTFLFKSIPDTHIKNIVAISLVLIASILTCIGVYDKIGEFGGAGAIIPITGFANSIISPAIEHRREGIITGLCANMFIIAGPVLVTGIVMSIIIGIVCFIIQGVPAL